jgi:hypothetical protein
MAGPATQTDRLLQCCHIVIALATRITCWVRGRSSTVVIVVAAGRPGRGSGRRSQDSQRNGKHNYYQPAGHEFSFTSH